MIKFIAEYRDYVDLSGIILDDAVFGYSEEGEAVIFSNTPYSDVQMQYFDNWCREWLAQERGNVVEGSIT